MKTVPMRALACSLLVTLSLTAAAEPLAGHPGDLDPNFGTGGYMTTDFVGTDEIIYSLAPLANGSFLAAGVVTHANVTAGTSENLAVARFLPNGQLDTSFAGAGLFHFDIAGGVDGARAMKVLAAGHILVAGSVSPGAYANFGVIKLLPNGNMDPDFGAFVDGSLRVGWNMLDIGGISIHDFGRALAVQPDGRIIVAGITPVLHASGFRYNHVAVARFLASGPIDTTFGGNGSGYVILPTTSPDSSDEVSGIATDQSGNLAVDGSIVVTGYEPGRNSGFIARLTANGTIDSGFGDSIGGGLRSGRVTLQAGVSGGVFFGVSEVDAGRLTADGKIVVNGTGSEHGVTFMRFMANGALDSSFGSNGRSTVKFSGSTQYDKAAVLALQGNGKLVAAGYATNTATGSPQKDFYVVRMLANGQPDSGFGDGQGRSVIQISTSTDEAFAIAVEPSGNLLVGGYQQRPGAANQQYDFVVLREFGDSDRIFQHGFENVAN